MVQSKENLMDKIISLCKRRGFVFPGSEIYGGLANSYEYGPAGVELKKNIVDLWWQFFIRSRSDMVGLDSSIILHGKVWEASGHTAGFADALIECRNCHQRTRADHLIENAIPDMKVEGKSVEELNRIVQENMQNFRQYLDNRGLTCRKILLADPVC
jgi:glycyl-tRNA synthetase